MAIEPDRLSESVRETIASARPVFLSAVSAFEIAVKWSIGKLALPAAPGAYLPTRLARSGVDPLPVDMRHALAAADLPWHHRDPFDRLLIAQAAVEGLAIVTHDRMFARYDIETIFAS